VLEEDEVERPQAVPEVAERRLHERAQESLAEDEQAADDSAVAADGEPVVPRPQPSPGLEVAGRLVEEVLDARSGPRLLDQGATPPAAR
jgi:hypothetical protein